MNIGKNPADQTHVKVGDLVQNPDLDSSVPVQVIVMERDVNWKRVTPANRIHARMAGVVNRKRRVGLRSSVSVDQGSLEGLVKSLLQISVNQIHVRMAENV